MRLGKLFLVCLCGLSLLAGCAQEELIPTDNTLRSVSVFQTEVMVPAEGTVTLSFAVDSPDYAFNYDAGSSACDVRLIMAGGKTPTGYTISQIVPEAQKGRYTLTLKDNGGIYREEVRLALVQNEVFITSAFFTVWSEKQYPGPLVKTGLPVVCLVTENGREVVSKEEYVPASLYIRGEGGYESLQPVSCQVRGRGNTTWTWPKKPYLIKLDQKESLLGMPRDKRWVLLANFMDRTLMRNLVSMHVASLTSLAWTPRCVPVELIWNGEHRGSYLLIEQVRVDGDRVDISEEDGYLLELDFHYDNTVQWIDHHGSCWQRGDGIPFGVKHPDPDEMTPEQKLYIKSYISEVAGVLYGDRFADPTEGYAKYLDVESFIDYWIVFEVMCNHELSNPGSVFFHKDKDGILTAGPCWDFDWGVLSFYTSNGEWDLVNGHAIWYDRLFQDPAFENRLKARFQQLLPALSAIPDYMDRCEELLKESASLNFALWNPAEDASQNGGHIINGDENLTFHAAVARLKSNYRKHLQVMEKALL